MITQYHRPGTLEEALTLLNQPDTQPLGGGTLLSHQTAGSVQVVDLQALGLDTLSQAGNTLELGATLTLQSLLESAHCPAVLKTTLKLEAPLNLRNSATVAGPLIACDGRSTFASMLLAMDARVTVKSTQSGEETLNLGDLLPLREQVRGKLITKVIIPTNLKLAFDYVAKTPSDKPLVCVAVAGWGSGRRRVSVGGYGRSPLLAMDGTDSDDAATAVRNAYHEAHDEWASAEYRMDVAATLVQRCLEQLA